LCVEEEREALYKAAEDAPVRGDARETRQNILHAIRARGKAPYESGIGHMFGDKR